MIETLTDPAILGPAMAIAGALIAKFAPAWVPFFGIGRKVIEELIKLHDKSPLPNRDIKKQAESEGLGLASKVIRQKLKD